jgi:serine/threonine protein kinase
VDVFSLGVILFVMVTGTMPYYQTASIDDPLYKHIATKDFKKYWKAWEEMRMKQIAVIDETELNK